MQFVQSLISRLAAIGPMPFLLFGTAVMGVGIALEMAGVALPGASTSFGLCAQIGGTLVLTGLVLFALRLEPPIMSADGYPDDMPLSARKASERESVESNA